MNLKADLRELSPAYFALIMSTGILSMAFNLLNYHSLAVIMTGLNNFQFVVLLILYLLRLLLFFPQVKEDFRSNEKGPGFLTIVAGSGVLGVQNTLIMQWKPASLILWGFALLVWAFLVYSFLTVMITKGEKPAMPKVVNGAWLLFTVSTQSLAILGVTLLPANGLSLPAVLFSSLSLFFLAVLLYVLMLSLILLRLVLEPLKPDEFKPPYWVLMGAAAISSLSAATLIEKINTTEYFLQFIPALNAASLALWSAATWLIPLLIILEGWRHLLKKVALKYDPSYWDTVFTLGMYTTATFRLAKLLDVNFLTTIPEVFIYIAAAAWVLTFAGMFASFFKAAPGGSQLNTTSTKH